MQILGQSNVRTKIYFNNITMMTLFCMENKIKNKKEPKLSDEQQNKMGVTGGRETSIIGTAGKPANLGASMPYPNFSQHSQVEKKMNKNLRNKMGQKTKTIIKNPPIIHK